MMQIGQAEIHGERQGRQKFTVRVESKAETLSAACKMMGRWVHAQLMMVALDMALTDER